MQSTQKVKLPSVATPAAYQEAVSEFFKWIKLEDFNERMYDMLESTIFSSEELGFDKDALMKFSFLYKRTTELISALSKLNTKNEIELCKN